MLRNLWRSFPVQLLLLHFQKNLPLILVWVVLFGVILQSFGVTLGIPFLFLDPEYLHEVSWISFFLMGIGVAILTMAFHMTTYILDGRKFPFLAILDRPFIHFSLNNSIIPTIFYLTYTWSFIQFQSSNAEIPGITIFWFFFAFVMGSLITYTLISGYFSLTNKGFFVLFAGTVDRRLRRVRLTRSQALSQYRELRKPSIKVESYLSLSLKKVKVRKDISRFEAAKLLKVFNQNHLNLVFIQLFLIAIVLILGFFKEVPIFQLPAGLSVMILFSILLMVFGAVSFWLKDWTTIAIVVFAVTINYFSNFDFLNRPHEAYGMNYDIVPAEYNLDRLDELLVQDTVRKDIENISSILSKWREQFPDSVAPKLLIVSASGGGQRSALWTFHVLQQIYGLDEGRLVQNIELMTGASGGVLGHAFFREILLRSKRDPSVDPLDSKFLDQLSMDNLNPIIFTLLVNDLLIRNQYFEYNGRSYLKDRGFAFERQFNENTKGILDKPLISYQEPEALGEIPLLPVSSLITNDGRKLVMSPHSMSFLGTSIQGLDGDSEKAQSIDFMRFFSKHDAGNLRFLTALRMSATFPFISPNVELPSNPVMETMDTGLSDNFGVQDALRFTYVFQKWISENTSGVVLITIRDSEKSEEIPETLPPKIAKKLFTPLRNIYSNWDNIQTIQNEVLYHYMNESMPFTVDRIEFEYNPKDMEEAVRVQNQQNLQRASLNWRLTAQEKNSILNNINSPKNQKALEELRKLSKEINQ